MKRTCTKVTTPILVVLGIACSFYLMSKPDAGIFVLLVMAVIYGMLAYLVVRTEQTLTSVEGQLAKVQNELRGANEQTERLAHVDALTGVLNTNGLQRVLPIEIDRARRSGSTLFGVLVDCDDFKKINEKVGQEGADLVLQTIAAKINDHIRITDQVCRVGPDEFIILLPDEHEGPVQEITDRILRGISQFEVDTPRGRVKATVSMGLAAVPLNAKNEDDILAATRAGLRIAKDTGKNKVALATDIVKS